MRNIKFFSFVIFLLNLVSCNKDAEFGSSEYPYILINEIKQINSNGVLVSAEIITLGNEKIIEYGFVWNKSEKPFITDFKLTITNKVSDGIFTGFIDNNLDVNETYWVRPYITCEKYTIYGTSKQFTSKGCFKPVIESVFPKTGKVGTELIIKAKHINSNPDKTIIRFNNENAEIIELKDSILTLKVPFIVNDAQITIISGNYNSTFDEQFIIVTPWNKISIPNDLDIYSWIYTISINGKGYFIYKEGKVYEFNPEDNSWIKKKTYPSSFGYKATTFSLGNKGYYGLGYDVSGRYKYDFWEFNPVNDTWRQLNDFPGKGIVDPISLVIGDSVFIGLGYEYGTYCSNELWVYHPESDKWIQKNNFVSNRGANEIFDIVLNNKGYVGLSPYNTNFYKYNLDNDTWNNLGNSPFEYSTIIGVSINNDGYFHINNINDASLRTIWRYTSDSNLWEKLSLSPANIFGGFSIDSFGYFLSYNNEFWRFDPSKL